VTAPGLQPRAGSHLRDRNRPAYGRACPRDGQRRRFWTEAGRRPTG